nr:hypothetical protein GCM10020092_039810 [Actinoplanes digitatis]
MGYDLLRLAVTAVLALTVLPPAGAMLLVFLTGGLAPVAQAARTALLADLLVGDAYVLGRSLFTVTSGAMQVVGAAVGGLLLVTAGPAGALWLSAVACGVSAIVVRFASVGQPARSAAEAGAVRQTWRVNGRLLRDAPLRSAAAGAVAARRADGRRRGRGGALRRAGRAAGHRRGAAGGGRVRHADR